LKRGVLDWAGAKREAQNWWNALEEQNRERPIELLLLAMQLATRQVVASARRRRRSAFDSTSPV